MGTRIQKLVSLRFFVTALDGFFGLNTSGSGAGYEGRVFVRSVLRSNRCALLISFSFCGLTAICTGGLSPEPSVSGSTAASAGIECAEYAPARVKQAVCGYGRADKGQVQRMVRTILSLETEPATSHAADALAVAICHALMPPLARLAS